MLEEVPKYLGVTISEDLKWGKCIEIISDKLNKTLLFSQTESQVCPPPPPHEPLKEQAYIKLSLVHSTMEYSATMWDFTIRRT